MYCAMQLIMVEAGADGDALPAAARGAVLGLKR
jgi:hypothetical protein